MENTLFYSGKNRASEKPKAAETTAEMVFKQSDVTGLDLTFEKQAYAIPVNASSNVIDDVTDVHNMSYNSQTAM